MRIAYVVLVTLGFWAMGGCQKKVPYGYRCPCAEGYVCCAGRCVPNSQGCADSGVVPPDSLDSAPVADVTAPGKAPEAASLSDVADTYKDGEPDAPLSQTIDGYRGPDDVGEPDGPPDQTVDEHRGPDDVAGMVSCPIENSERLGLVKSVRTLTGKATGIALDGNTLFMSSHGVTSNNVPEAAHPCPDITLAGEVSAGVIEAFDIRDPLDPVSTGKGTCISDANGVAQEVWTLAAEHGNLFAAADYVGVVRYRIPANGNLAGLRPMAAHLPPDIAPSSLPSEPLPFGQCDWIRGGGLHAPFPPAAGWLTVVTPPGWTKRIGLAGYSYCNLFGIYDLSGDDVGSATIPVLTYYRSPPSEGGAAEKTTTVAWSDEGDRFYAMTMVYNSSTATSSIQFEVVRFSGPSETPVRLGSVLAELATAGSLGSLVARGRYVYWAAARSSYNPSPSTPDKGGLRIFDVADPTHPTLAGSLDIDKPGFVPVKGATLTIDGTTAYFAGADRLWQIDVSDPLKPVVKNKALFMWPAEFGTCHGGYPMVAGDYVFVAVNCFSNSSGEGPGTGGLAIYRAKQPALPQGNEWVDLNENHLHCSACNHACSPYQTCSQGTCVPH